MTRIRRSFLWWCSFILIVSPLSLVSSAEPYQGKYRTQADWKGFEESVQNWRDDALRAVELALGVRVPEGFSVEIAFEDMPLNPNKGIQTATTTTVRRNGRPVQRILLRPELHFGHMVDLKTELLHEMTHAVMRAVLGDRHRDLPRWVREGLAVWTAKQGEEKIILNLAYHWHEVRPTDRLLDGLEGRHRVTDYAEDYLAFAYLEDRGGSAWVRRFMNGLAEGRTYREALQDVCGLDWPTFQKEARRHGETVLRRYVEASQARYREGYEWYGAGRYAEALKVFEALASQPSPMASQFRYYQARSLQQLGRWKEAEEVFDALQSGRSGPSLGGLLDEAAFYWAECAKSAGLLEEAASRFGRVALHYPFSPLAPRALSQQVEAWTTLGQAERARPVFQVLLTAYPQSPWTARAASALGEMEVGSGESRDGSGLVEQSEPDEDHDEFLYLKPSKSVRDFMRRLGEAMESRDWDTAVELMTVQWKPSAFDDVPVETEPNSGAWVSFSRWVAGMAERLPPAQALEVKRSWELSAKASVAKQDITWETLKVAFEWPGDLPSKQALLGRAGLLAWDEGQRPFGWLMVEGTAIPSLRRLKPWAVASSAQIGLEPPLSRRWVWKAPQPVQAAMPAPNRVWVILKDGRLVPVDVAVGEGGDPGASTGLVHHPLRGHVMVRWNPKNPVIPLSFIDVALEEFWTAYLPETFKAKDRNPMGGMHRASEWALAGCSSEERVYFIETQTFGLGVEPVLHACVSGSPSLKWLWSRSLGQFPTPLGQRVHAWHQQGQQNASGPRVVVQEAGPRWIALHQEEVLMAGNVFTGAIEWMWQITPPQKPKDPKDLKPPEGVKRPPAPGRVAAGAAVILVEDDTIVCGLPSQSAVFAVESRSGRLKWWKNFSSEPSVVGTQGGRLFIATRDDVMACALSDGSEVWKAEAKEAEARNGLPLLKANRLYVPWGRSLSVYNAVTGKLIGSVERALGGWCSLVIEGEVLYEVAEEGLAAWQPAQALDRLEKAWKERKDVSALAQLAAFQWLNNREPEALEYLMTWLRQAPPDHPDQRVQTKRLSEWLQRSSKATLASPVWIAAWEEAHRRHRADKDVNVLWALGRAAEHAGRKESAITAYQSLLALAPEIPQLTTVEGSTLMISLIVTTTLDRLREGPRDPAWLPKGWTGPLREAWSFALPPSGARPIVTPHGLVVVHADGRLALVGPEAPLVKWEVKLKVSPQFQYMPVQVGAAKEYLAVAVPARSILLLHPMTGATLKEFGLPKTATQPSVVDLWDGVAVIQAGTQGRKGAVSTNAVLLDGQGNPVMKGAEPVLLDLGNYNPQQVQSGFQPLVAHGERVFVVSSEGGRFNVTAYRREGLVKEWSFAVPATPPNRQVGPAALQVVDDRLLAVMSFPDVRLLDQATGLISATLAVTANHQLVALRPNRLVTSGYLQAGGPRQQAGHVVMAQDFQGAVIWSHPGQSWGAGDSVVAIRGTEELKLHDLQTGAEIGIPSTGVQATHVGFGVRPTAWYLLSPAAGPTSPPKVTSLLPAK